MNWWDDVDWQDPINRDCPLNAGILGWWMGAPGLFGGTRMWDLTNGNHGTLANMDPATDWVAAENGPVLDFDGTNDYVSQPLSASLAALPRFTMLAIMRTTSTANGMVCGEFGQNSGAGTFGLNFLEINEGGSDRLRFVYRQDDSAAIAQIAITSAGVADGRFHTVAGVRRATNSYELVVDGVSRGTSTTSVANMTNVFGKAIGAQVRGTIDRYYLGDVFAQIGLSTDLTVPQLAAFDDQFRRGFPDMLNHWRRRSIFLPPVATFNPAWALRQSRIIGGGVI